MTGPAAPGARETGASVDAYRRHRSSPLRQSPSALLGALADAQPSESPSVVFARLAQACVPAFSEGCEVEILLAGEPAFRLSVTGSSTAGSPDRTAAVPSPRTADRHGRTGYSVSVPVSAPPLAGHPGYAGVVSFWWRAGRGPRPEQHTTAGLVVQHGVDLVRQARLLGGLAAAEARAADAAVHAIVSRQVNLAVGILMHDRDCSADDAEQALRELATRRDVDLYGAAAAVVRSARGPGTDPGTGSPRHGGGPHHLRPVPTSGDADRG